MKTKGIFKLAFWTLLLLTTGALSQTTTMAVDDGTSIPLAPGYLPLGYSAPVPGTYTLPVLGTAADGLVLDGKAHVRHLHQIYQGKISLLGFVYSTCDDVNGCPLANGVFLKVRKSLKADKSLAEKTRLITFSFNPEHDTPAAMARFAHDLDADDSRVEWQFLTSRSETELQPILKAYGQTVEKELDPKGQPTGKISHILRVFLIDENHNIRNIYTTSFLHADTVLADIKTLIAEQASSTGHSGKPDETFKSTANNNALSLRAGDVKTGYASTNYQTHSIALTDRQGKSANLFANAGQKHRGLPELKTPPENPLTPAKIALGRKLFYDRRLSLNNTFSCAMCHIAEQGFTSQEQNTAVGMEGRTVRRNSPTLYNVAYFERLFHDGRESTLENQVWGPLLAHNEMGNPSIGFVIDKIISLPDYRGLFEAAFKRPPGMETIGMAIASYERTLVSGNSAFDQFKFGHNSKTLTPEAQKGFELFTGKAGCANCHTIDKTSALFTDQQLHNTGIGYKASMQKTQPKQPVQLAPGITVEVDSQLLKDVSEPKPNDLGLYEITLNPADRWKYKTPSLRNITLTAPYMHDGSLATLREVLDFYNKGGEANENLDPLIKPLNLTEAEINALEAYLGSLSGDNVNKMVADAFAAPVGNAR